MKLITVSIPQTDGYYSRTGRKRFLSLLGVFPVTPIVVTNSVENGFNDAFPSNSSTQNELKIKKIIYFQVLTRLSKQNLDALPTEPNPKTFLLTSIATTPFLLLFFSSSTYF